MSISSLRPTVFVAVGCCPSVLQLSCPWGLGQWRGEWSSDSGMWERYPSIKAELLLPRQPESSAEAKDGRCDDDRGEEPRAKAAAEAEAAATLGSGKRAREKATTFWMTFDDFTAEFSQARSRSCLLLARKICIYDFQSRSSIKIF